MARPTTTTPVDHNTYHGKPCDKCGGTLRKTYDRKCLHCRRVEHREYSKQWRAAMKASKDPEIPRAPYKPNFELHALLRLKSYYWEEIARLAAELQDLASVQVDRRRKPHAHASS